MKKYSFIITKPDDLIEELEKMDDGSKVVAMSITQGSNGIFVYVLLRNDY